ncbi:MAG: hypothetical protein RBR95_12490, partial [Ignavibacteriaceae bacterium]|nr:hypothetical protein [Ignavibacteriaceae bacterium]
MKRLILICAIFLITGMTLNVYGQTSPDYIFGDGWGSGWDWTTGTQGGVSLGSSYKWQFQATADNNLYFKFGETSSNSDGSGFWYVGSGGDVSHPGDGTKYTAIYHANMNDAGAFYWAVQNGNWYVIKSKKQSGNDADFAIFNNGAQAPVNINSITHSVDATNLYIDVQMSGAKSTVEKVWVRYTTDDWATSQTVQASTDMGGNVLRATIARTQSVVEYYAYTTIQQMSAPAEADADFYTVNYISNDGSNYVINLVTKLNYVLTSSTASWEYLSGASTFTWNGTSPYNDEGYSTAENIGFSFYYCGTEYTQFQVSTNGFIRFGSDLASATVTDALNGALRKVIAPLWHDLAVVDVATDVTYKLSGTTPNQVLTVEWKNVKWNYAAAAPNAEFQLKLYEHDG